MPSVIEESEDACSEEEISQANLNLFLNSLPVFNCIGHKKYISSEVSYQLRKEDQIFFKYLKAYKKGWIDLCYQVIGDDESNDEKRMRKEFCDAVGQNAISWLKGGKMTSIYELHCITYISVDVYISFGVLPDLSPQECSIFFQVEEFFPIEITRKKLTMKQYIGLDS